MTRSIRCKRGSLSRNGTESRNLNSRHRKSSCNGLDGGEKNRLIRLQSFLSKEYILSRVFRKDGPLLGLEFDHPPANAPGGFADIANSHCCQDEQRVGKRRKVLKTHAADSSVGIHTKNVPEKKHGKGKALMTVWRACQSSNGKFPRGLKYFDGKVNCFPYMPSVKAQIQVQKSSIINKISALLIWEQKFLDVNFIILLLFSVQKQGKSKKKVPKKPPRRRKVLGNMDDANFVEPRHPECKLMIDETQVMYQLKSFTPLIDDEELELLESEEASTAFRCCAHLCSSGEEACPLCKDVLARFPPKIVKMKQPITTTPWDSSPELVKKLFKVFQFLYNHATAIELCYFTLDDLAQAFSDKDSLLLGKVHVGLLKLLLLSAEREISSGFVSRSSKDCRFLSFLQCVREREFDVNIWIKSLNSLSWTEILRQVLIAAGYGAKHNSARRDINSKERNLMAHYSLHPCTLKGELFRILSKQGNLGLKVSELVKAQQIVTLDILSTTEEQEELIKSTLSSDITLFEKIGAVAYRLRSNHQIIGKDGIQSEDNDSGSVEDEYSDAYTSDSTDDSEDRSGACGQRIAKYRSRHERTQQKLIECTEIDESYSGEAWVQGLVEGDYSNLSTGEKLDALVALVDLIGACSSLLTIDPEGPIPTITSSSLYLGSGAKIKKLPSKIIPISSNICEGSAYNLVAKHVMEKFSQTGSSSVVTLKGQSSGGTEATAPNAHPMKSIHLGSDRRYNNYWLFLGPCDATDPGHRRIYFESSEDGHWQAIETTQALRDLLLVLDCRGTREANLFSSLAKREAFLCQAMEEFLSVEYRCRQTKGSDQSELDSNSGDGSSPNSDIDNILVSPDSTYICSPSSSVFFKCKSSTGEKKKKWDRLQAYDRWIWGSFYSNLNAVKNYRRPYMESLTYCESCHDLYWKDEKHCKVCHSTFEINIDVEERYAIHVVTCRETDDVRDFPKHKVLPSQLQALKAAIHSIEGSMPPGAFSGGWKCSAHKLWVKRLRRTSSMPELVQVISDFVSAMNEKWLLENVLSLCSTASLEEIILYFETMPKTTSALALWMVKLDFLIAPYLEKLQSEKLPSRRPQSKGK
ncbi:hypothetical protein KSP39_PZI003979 [Platanthera zijinensis]|uniref:DDT domain-containing protein n=1 Tax=Platanthera zijinensis TaxID=2320716 RepID=A0AAP0GC70_9ASPA